MAEAVIFNDDSIYVIPEPFWLRLPNHDTHQPWLDVIATIYPVRRCGDWVYIKLPGGTKTWQLAGMILYETPDDHQFKIAPSMSPRWWAWDWHPPHYVPKPRLAV